MLIRKRQASAPPAEPKDAAASSDGRVSMGRQAIGHGGRLLHGVLWLALTLSMVLVVIAGGLAWRLSRGPIELEWLARRIEASANTETPPMRLHIGGLSLAWGGWRHGADQPLEFVIRDARVQEAGDETAPVVAVIPRAELALSPGALLIGRLVPRRLEAQDVDLHLRRAADGSVSLNLGSGPPSPLTSSTGPQMQPSALSHELSRPASNDRTHGYRRFSQMRFVSLTGHITVTDQQLGTEWQVQDINVAMIRKWRGGIDGNATARLMINNTTTSVKATAMLQPDNASTRIVAETQPINPAQLAGDTPALAPLRAYDAPVRMKAAAVLDSALTPRAYQLQADSGAGKVMVADTPLRLAQASLSLDGTPDQVQLHTAEATLQAPSGLTTTVRVSGRAHPAPPIQAALDVTIDHMAFADLGALCPPALGGNVRPWLVQNITAGTAHDGTFHVALAGADWQHVKPTDAKGQLQGDGITASWLRPVPPLEHGQALLTLLSADTLNIAVPTAQQGPLQIHDGLIHIDGLSVHDQVATITTGITGQVADMIALLRHPKLKLLSTHPVRLDSPAGSVDAKLSVNLPLEKDVRIEQIAIHGQGKLDAVHLSHVALDQDLNDGDLDLDVTNDGLTATGQAKLGQIPADLGIKLDFRAGSPDQVTQRITVAAEANEAQLAAADFDPGELARGKTGINVDYAMHRGGNATADIRMDLTHDTLALPELGWEKKPGTLATAHANIRMQHDQVMGIDDLRAEAPGLIVAGHTSYRAGKANILSLDRIEVGGTRATGTLQLPAHHGEPYRATILGTDLDLKDRLHGEAQDTPQKSEAGPPWQLDARFDRVHLSEHRIVRQMTVHAEASAGLLRQAQLNTLPPEKLHMALVSEPTGTTRHLTGSAEDAGALLHAFGVMPSLHGGQITLDARFDDTKPDHPLAGRAEMSNFQIDAPAAVKLAQAATLYGLLDAARGPALNVVRLIAPFRLNKSIVHLNDARAYNASIGITAEGQINLDDNSTNLSGTIVPAYFFNSLLGRVPLLGRLFSPERGGGIFSASYTLRGSLDKPQLSVNPLTTLAPGVLRGLMEIKP